MFTIENDIIEVKYVEANAAHNAAVNTSLTADNALIDYLARNLPKQALNTSEVRYIPAMRRDEEAWDVAGRRIQFALSSGTQGMRNLTPIHYSSEFGNPFIYYMEYFSRHIVDAIDALIHMHDALITSKEQLLNPALAHKEEAYEAATALQKAFSAKEQKLSKHVQNAMQWAGKGEVSRDARTFFDIYTAAYFGESLSIEGLAWWFDSQRIQDDAALANNIIIEIEPHGCEHAA